MSKSTQEMLRFPPVDGLSVRADFDGGAMSSDVGPLILRGLDQQIGLTERLAQAIDDQRHASYITHPLRDLLAQRIFQIGCGDEDGNDANALRRDPLFKLGVERRPLDEAMNLASGPTFSRLENAVSTKDIYRMAQAFVDPFIASYPEAPEVIVIDLDHSEDPTHGQQEFSFYNQYYQSHCYLPLFLFEGLSGKFITAALRPDKRPTGAENAMILKRVMQRLRAAWPETHLVLRGDAHFANPELLALALADGHTDFIFGLAGNRVLSPLAKPFLDANRRRHAVREANARRLHQPLPNRTRSYHEMEYAAGTWPQAFRVILKAEVMAVDDKPRFVVTSLDLPSPECLYRDLYRARGQDENFIKMLKNDLASDRTSDHRFLANHLRLFFACGAYVLHHALRTSVLANTELAQAQPATVILKLFKIAVCVLQYKDRVKLQLPSNCPVKALLHRLTEILFLTPLPDSVTT
ncbi:IS1380 family transposase [Thiocystis violascens]|uniref:Transposase family protein n=1 Tax=Thiocystis violascens (strain ATCC 17096 / DSM 198 / 6111) TaxID=765911 RepID=I3Y9W8_THIV6|nr:IS1380 family transposase [Thiocystis violascens]AFL73786.1 transposase family protein [Thiocystis violascens DSM 198]